MNPFGGSEPEFDPADAFVPEHVPEPGQFLQGHDVLVGNDHVTVHRHAADAFEEYGVYDATFGYNLARLNRDPRHTDAGLRYAEEADDTTTLRAEFTPTTAFCPQAEPLAVGTYRALDAVDAHGYERVRVRVDAALHGSAEVNARLERLETDGIDGIDGIDGTDKIDGTDGIERSVPFEGTELPERSGSSAQSSDENSGDGSDPSTRGPSSPF